MSNFECCVHTVSGSLPPKFVYCVCLSVPHQQDVKDRPQFQITCSSDGHTYVGMDIG